MNSLRRFSGWLALLFGIIGMLACLAAAVAIWIWAQQVRGTVDRLAGRVSEFTTEVSVRSGPAADWLENSQVRLQTMQGDLRTGLAEAIENSRVDPERLEAMVSRVRTMAVELREWITVAETTRTTVDLVRELLASLAVLAKTDIQEDVESTVMTAIDELKEVGAALEELEAAVAKARSDQKPIAPETRAKSLSLLSRSVAALGVLHEHTTNLQAAVNEMELSVMEVKKTVQLRLTLAQVIVTFVLIWQAVAQWCLAGWGGRTVRPA